MQLACIEEFLPQNICQQCISRLNEFKKFRKHCQDNNKLIRKHSQLHSSIKPQSLGTINVENTEEKDMTHISHIFSYAPIELVEEMLKTNEFEFDIDEEFIGIEELVQTTQNIDQGHLTIKKKEVIHKKNIFLPNLSSSNKKVNDVSQMFRKFST